MARKGKKTARVSRVLILGYLEKISSKIFSDFPKQLTDLVGRQHGVYALYKGNRLYYVGLAANLRGRIKQHLRDKHAGKWDKFSVYLIRKADHIRELESIVMRVADPAGNAARGRLPRAENLRPDLLKRIKAQQERQINSLLGGKARGKVTHTRKPLKSRKGSSQSLAPYIKGGFRIRGQYKGKAFRATVYRSGTINFDGKLYNSPSMAGRAARGRSTNGWTFWRFKNKRGEWVKLDQLRR